VGLLPYLSLQQKCPCQICFMGVLLLSTVVLLGSMPLTTLKCPLRPSQSPLHNLINLFLVWCFGRNWLRYVLPAILLSCAGILFSFRGLKAQGRLGGDFGKVTIRDQPPTNTIQKIMALKEALMALENFLQTANIALLKLRTVALARHLAVSCCRSPHSF
jgi:hypothetical protein